MCIIRHSPDIHHGASSISAGDRRPRRYVHPTYSIANETELTTVQALYYLLILTIDDELSKQLAIWLWQPASYALQTG